MLVLVLMVYGKHNLNSNTKNLKIQISSYLLIFEFDLLQSCHILTYSMI